MFSLRPASEADFPAIKGLIRAVKINPTGLDWRRFVVAVTAQGEMIGCGQLKPHGDGTWELASLAVIPEWRGRGVARALIETLVEGYFGAGSVRTKFAQRSAVSAQHSSFSAEQTENEAAGQAGEAQGKAIEPLYLTCRSGLGPFYERFGFRVVAPDEMPPYFRRVSRFARVAKALGMINEGLLVMKREPGL